MISLVGSVQKSAARPPPFYARHNVPGPPLLRRQVSTDRKMPARSFTPGGHIPSFSNSKNPLFRCLFILFFVFLSLYLLLCILLSLSFSLYSSLCIFYSVFFSLYLLLCILLSVSFTLYSSLCIFFSVSFSLYLFLCILLSVSFSLYSFLQLLWLLSGAFPVLLTALYIARYPGASRLPVRTFLPPFSHKGNPVLHYRALHNLKAVGIQCFLHFLCFGIYDPGADKKCARRHQLRRDS